MKNLKNKQTNKTYTHKMSPWIEGTDWTKLEAVAG